MGESARRIRSKDERVVFDYAAVRVSVSRADREAFEGLTIGAEGDSVEVKLVKHTIATVVNCAFPGPRFISGRDAVLYADWTETFDDPATSAEVTRGMVDFLRKHVGDDALGTPPNLARSRLTLLDYLDSLRDAPAAE